MRARQVVIYSAALVCALWTPGARGVAQCTEPGKSRWGAKSNVPKGSSITKAKTVALDKLMALPDPNPKPKQSQPTTGLIAAADLQNDLGITEGDMIRTSGYLRLVATEDNDCEYHMQLSPAKDSKTSLIIEVAKDDALSIHSTFVRGHAKTVREWIRQNVTNDAEPPDKSVKALADPPYVEVVGQLFFDSAHSSAGQRGKAGIPASTLWELHPVLAIKPSSAGGGH